MPRKLSEIIQAGLPQAVVGGNRRAWPPTSRGRSRSATRSCCRSRSASSRAITPWNYPLHQIVIKVAAALVAGLHDRPQAERGGPAQRVHARRGHRRRSACRPACSTWCRAPGPVVGEALAAHPEVDMVSFTGSTRAGKRVAELAAADRQEGGARARRQVGEHPARRPRRRAARQGREVRGRRLLPELRPDLHARCTRLLVPRDRHDEVVEMVRDEVESTWTVGDPATNAGRLGPAHLRARSATGCAAYIEKGVDEGATLVTGGAEAPEGLDTGYYVRPTVFADVDTSMTIAQEEIFGPVLSIIPYDDEDDAVRIANDSIYGLVGRGVVGATPSGPRPWPAGSAPGSSRSTAGRSTPLAPVRRLQAVGHRPRARPVRPRGVPPDQVDAALTGSSCGEVRRRPTPERRSTQVVRVLQVVLYDDPDAVACAHPKRLVQLA